MSWEFDLAYGARWEKENDNYWILVADDGRYVARVVGDIPEELRDEQ